MSEGATPRVASSLQEEKVSFREIIELSWGLLGRSGTIPINSHLMGVSGTADGRLLAKWGHGRRLPVMRSGESHGGFIGHSPYCSCKLLSLRFKFVFLLKCLKSSGA